jgi:hypothetical protein
MYYRPSCYIREVVYNKAFDDAQEMVPPSLLFVWAPIIGFGRQSKDC